MTNMDVDLELHGIYKSSKLRLNDVNIHPDDQQNSPSRRNLKKQGLKYFNKKSLTEQYVKFNEPDTVELSTTLQDNILVQLGTGLLENHFRGQFHPVGSFYDGTKVTLVNEFDCMFVCDGSQYQLQKLKDDDIAYKVFDGDREVDAEALRTQFADLIDQIGETLVLPERLSHGGFASPKFSGVRINKPAITLLFVWQSSKKFPTKWKPMRRRTELSIDITLALSVPASDEEEVTKDLRTLIEPVDSLLSVPLDSKGKVHLIPVVDDWWNITSTVLEGDLLKHIQDVPIKTCIKLAKITVYNRISQPDMDQKYVHKHCASNDIKTWQTEIESELERYRTSTTKTNSNRRRVQHFMRHGHILLTPDISRKYDDIQRSPASVVSASIKHLTLRAYLETEKYHQNYEDVEFDMLVDVFKSLGDLKTQTVRHFLLPEDIKMISVAPYAQEEADELIRAAKFECMRLGKRLSGTKAVGAIKKYAVNNQRRIIGVFVLLFLVFLVL